MQKLSAKYIGLIGGALMVVIFLLMFYSFHQPENGKVQYACYGIYTAAIILALIRFKSSSSPVERSFKDYFSEGFKAFVVMVLIMAVFTFIFYKLNPQIIDNHLAEVNKYNEQDTNKTPAELADNTKQLKNIFIPMTVGITTVMYLIIGALVTLVGAGLLSQKSNNR
jgi:cobalamin synthase